MHQEAVSHDPTAPPSADVPNSSVSELGRQKAWSKSPKASLPAARCPRGLVPTVVTARTFSTSGKLRRAAAPAAASAAASGKSKKKAWMRVKI